MLENIAFILYNTPEYSEKVQVVIKANTLWMTQKAMAELFGVDKSSISRHLKNIFETGELEEKVVVRGNWKKKWLLQKLKQPLNMVQ